VQVVCPRYKSLYKSLRHDLQLTCFVLTVAIYSCSVAVITWPTSRSADHCQRRVTSRYNSGNEEDDRPPWTGRSFDDKRSSSSSGHVTRDIVTSVQIQRCHHQQTSAGNMFSTLTLTWCSLIGVIYLVYVVECWFSPSGSSVLDRNAWHKMAKQASDPRWN